MSVRLVVGLVAVVLASLGAGAHPEGPALGEWTFVPAYTLPGNGDQTLGPRPVPPESPRAPIAYTPAPASLFGLTATDRVTHLLDRGELPDGPFTAELWVVDHVNRPVGVLLAAKGRGATDDIAWAVGYADGRAIAHVAGDGREAAMVESPTKSLAFKKYWRHIVAVYDGTEVRLYVNGRAVTSADAGFGKHQYDPTAQLEIAAYTEHEPFMVTGNIVHSARVFDHAMDDGHIRERFRFLASAVEEGIVFPGRMHFTAGPYLNMTTQTSTALLWETDRPTTGVVRFAEPGGVERVVELDARSRLHEVTLDGLEPGVMYTYRVLARDDRGASIDSGLLTFQTAHGEDHPFTFAVIGDTEARPHVNDRMANLIWEQRPNFVITCGDLTDGGKKDHRFQWTHEYFQGVGHLHSRIPVFPVAGNGEGDLYWYNHYHALPEPEGYYSFRWGNAEFFMLDSNRSGSDFRPGGEQYEWLAERLAASTAVWKFAAHHHPTFTSDENDYGNTWKGEPSPLGDVNVQPIMELYEKFAVDAVFFGHLHSYERSWPLLEGKVSADEGVVYIQTGGAGGNLEDFRPAKTWFNHNAFRGHHFCVISIHGGVLEFRMFNQDGSLRDVTRLTKETGDDAFAGVEP